MAAKEKKQASAAGTRRKNIFIGLTIIIVLVAILAVVFSGIEKEALTTDEIISKKEWDDQELTEVLITLNMKHKRNGQNKEVLKHLRAQMNKRSKAERRQITENVIIGVVDRITKSWRELDQENRDKIVLAFTKEIEINRKRLEKLDPERKKKLSEEANKKENQKWIRELNAKIINSLSPDDRQALAPLSKKIISTIESM